ncbi:MAG: TIGR00730 family Rossman fold protein [Candidatus Doudnabacteria bacterium]|nr:TIGR00730 family Rossman fold protein [Candidatus Doudnabacteria bacterium]
MHGRVPPLHEDHEHRDFDYGAESFDFERNPSWRIFRIMAEFVDGFHFISKFEKSVTFFGSARFDERDEHYRAAQKLARLLAKAGYTVITGGGPGIMEAANKGAVEGGGESVGLNIQLPFAQRINPYVKKGMAFNYFFTRKVMLAFSAEAYIFFPGGYGTLDEAFEMITLRQTHKINPRVPIVLIGRDYWEPLAEWLRENALEKHGTIDEEEMKLFAVVDTPEEALAIIKSAKLAK